MQKFSKILTGFGGTFVLITAYRASTQASGRKPEGLVGLTCLQSLLPPSGQEGEVSPTLNKTTHNFSDLTTRTLMPVIQTEAADRNAGRMHVSPWRVLPVPETDPYNPCWLPDSYACPRPEAEAVSWLSSGDSLRAHSWTKRTQGMLNSTVKVKRPQVVGAAQEKHSPLPVLKELTVCGCWAPPDSQ